MLYLIQVRVHDTPIFLFPELLYTIYLAYYLHEIILLPSFLFKNVCFPSFLFCDYQRYVGNNPIWHQNKCFYHSAIPFQGV